MLSPFQWFVTNTFCTNKLISFTLHPQRKSMANSTFRDLTVDIILAASKKSLTKKFSQILNVVDLWMEAIQVDVAFVDVDISSSFVIDLAQVGVVVGDVHFDYPVHSPLLQVSANSISLLGKYHKILRQAYFQSRWYFFSVYSAFGKIVNKLWHVFTIAQICVAANSQKLS